MTTSKFILSILLLGGIYGCNRVIDEETATKGKLTVCTAESLHELIQTEAAQFNSLYPEAKISVFGAATREAIVYLFNDSVRVIITDRRINAEEQEIAKQAKLDLEEIKIAQDALAVIVNHRNAITAVSLESLKDILLKKVTNWNQFSDANLSGPIELVLTGRNSGAYELLKNYFFKLNEELPAVILASQQEVLDYVARHLQSIGLISLACYKSPGAQSLTTDTTAAVKALAFTGLDSTGQKTLFKLHQANVYLGRYPLHYPVYIYFRKNSPLALGFSGFIAGATGQKIILNWGLVPVTMPVRIVTIT